MRGRQAKGWLLNIVVRQGGDFVRIDRAELQVTTGVGSCESSGTGKAITF